MPRRKPLQNKPSTPRKQNSEFKYTKNYDFSASIPCVNNRCPGFMFLILCKYGINTSVMDELECFTCKRIRKLGVHEPNRNKPKPFKNTKKHYANK
jgi:hypothetical protein